MSRKKKGIDAERELIHMFWREGWVATRVAGSGSSKYPSPDIIAMKNNKVYAIECKITKTNYQYISKEDIEQLKEFSKVSDVVPIVGVKFNRLGWFFFFLHNLKETENNYMISRSAAKERGFGFKNLVENLS